jgi:hypothetical protein
MAGIYAVGRAFALVLGIDQVRGCLGRWREDLAAGLRWPVEEGFEFGKGPLRSGPIASQALPHDCPPWCEQSAVTPRNVTSASDHAVRPFIGRRPSPGGLTLHSETVSRARLAGPA